MNKIIAYNTSAYGDCNYKRAKLTYKNLKLNIDAQGHVIFSKMSDDLKFSILSFTSFFFYKSKVDNFVKGLKNILSAYDEASIEAAVKPIVEDIMMAAPTFERFDEFLQSFIDEDIFKTSAFFDSAVEMGKDFPSFGKELYAFAVKKKMGTETISRIAHLNKSDSHKLNNELFTNLLVDSIKTYKNPNYSATNSLSLFFEEVFKLMISEAQDSRINHIQRLRELFNDNPDKVKDLEDHITKLNAKEIELFTYKY